jgi:hypothetical protein
MADEGGISDFAAIAGTRREDPSENGGLTSSAASGFRGIGATLGQAFTGGNPAQNDTAEMNGMRVGAQTANALAEAKDRVMKSQAAEAAAQSMESPALQSQLGFSPEIGHLAAQQARLGAKPEELTQMLLQNQQWQMRSKLADPNADPKARLGSAFGLDPAGAIPKAEGANGTFSSPLQYDPSKPGGPNNTPVTVGADQHALNQSEISQRNAAADASSAKANAADDQATANGGAGKPPAGYRWKMNPDTMDLALDSTGRPIAEPIPGMPEKSGEGAVNSRYHAVVLQAANGISREAENLAKMGITTSAGAGGLAGHGGGGLLNTLTDNLGKTLSDTDQQQYTSSMKNVGRFLGMIENSGRMPAGSMATSAEQAVLNQPGTTEGARLYNAALMRQTVEAGQDTIHASKADQPVKDQYDKAVAAVQKAIPFTPADVIEFERAGKGMTVQQFLDSKNKAANAPAGGAHPDDIQSLIDKYTKTAPAK